MYREAKRKGRKLDYVEISFSKNVSSLHYQREFFIVSRQKEKVNVQWSSLKLDKKQN